MEGYRNGRRYLCAESNWYRRLSDRPDSHRIDSSPVWMDCRVILVGDPTIAPDEFFDSWIWQGCYKRSGADWLLRLAIHFLQIMLLY